MDASAYVREHPRMIQWAVYSCFDQPRLCAEKHARNFKQLSDIFHKI